MLSRTWSWARGKKTYLVAGFFLLLVGGLVAAGHLTPELALDILVFAAPCFAVTFRSALETHHSEVLATLVAIADAGVDLRAHNHAALALDAEAIAETAGPMLVPRTGILSGGWPDKSIKAAD